MKYIWLQLALFFSCAILMPFNIIWSQDSPAATANPVVEPPFIATPSVIAKPSVIPVEVTNALNEIRLVNQYDSTISYKLGNSTYDWQKGESLVLSLNYDSLNQNLNLAFIPMEGAPPHPVYNSKWSWWIWLLIILGAVSIAVFAFAFAAPNKGDTPSVIEEKPIPQNPNFLTRVSDYVAPNSPLNGYFSDYVIYKWLYEAYVNQPINDPAVIYFYNVLHFTISSVRHLKDATMRAELLEKAKGLENYPQNDKLTHFMACNCREHDAKTLQEYLSMKNDPLCDFYIELGKRAKAIPQNELWYLYELIESSLNRIGLDTYFNKIDKKNMPEPTVHHV